MKSMKDIILFMLLLGAVACAHVPASGRKFSSTGDLPLASPNDVGFSADKLAMVQAVAEQIHSPAGIVLVKGSVIFSWGDPSQKMWIHSCRKSFLSALIGIAVSRNQIDLSQTLKSLEIDDIVPSLTAEEKQARIIDLLEARSGIYHLATEDTPGMKEKRPQRGSHAPGIFWYYNNWDFNTLGFIYEKRTSISIFESFSKEIALPLGMQDYSPADGRYSFDKTLSQYPAYLFNMSTRDMARFGQLYLQNGKWSGQQIISADWVAASVTADSDASPPAGRGYGYLWWIDGQHSGSLFTGVDLGSGAFAAEGYGGHYIVVIPKLEMVVVSRADDAWFEQDVENRNIGPNREGKLLQAILNAKIQ